MLHYAHFHCLDCFMSCLLPETIHGVRLGLEAMYKERQCAHLMVVGNSSAA